MRLKIYTGTSMKAAMDEVRKALGDDAIIVNIDKHNQGKQVRITAALAEVDHTVCEPHHSIPTEVCDYDSSYLDDILTFHNLDAQFLIKLQKSSMARSNNSLQEALTLGLDSLLKFKSIDVTTQDALMLVGQGGQGKTLVAVRLAMQARRARGKVRIITTDSASAGSLEQLKAFCQPLDIDFAAAHNLADLQDYLSQDFNGFTVIDTDGLNPYALEELKALATFCAASKVELVWVFAANSDQVDISESAEILKSMGVKRFIATRCDTSRRFSTILNALNKSQMTLAALSTSPYVADSLLPGTAHSLAHAMLHKASANFTTTSPKFKVAS